MKTLTLGLVTVTALVLATAAAAKGPSAATISGPGLAAPLAIGGVGEGDTSTDLGVLVADGGFFPQVFSQVPSPLLLAQPANLGERYVVTYTMPGPTTATLSQDLYPYAEGGPVTYMRAGQTFWDTERTVGGWYRGTGRLKAMLMRVGLPKAAPAERDYVALIIRLVLRNIL
jgi:hypothetical protein